MNSSSDLKSLLAQLIPSDPSLESRQRLLHNLRQRHVPGNRSEQKASAVQLPRLRVALRYAIAAAATWIAFSLHPSVWKSIETNACHTSRQVLVCLRTPEPNFNSQDDLVERIRLNRKNIREWSMAHG